MGAVSATLGVAPPEVHAERSEPIGLRAASVFVALVAIGLSVVGLLDAPSHAGPAPGVRVLLVTAWAVAGLVLGAGRRPQLGIVVAGAAFFGGLCSATAYNEDLSRLHGAASMLIAAAALHMELALPEGKLDTQPRRRGALVGWIAAFIAGVAIAAADIQPSAWAVAAIVIGALLLGLPAANQRYLRTAGVARQRLQLVGCGVALIVEAVLVICALRVLVGWPDHAAAAAASMTVLLPIALALGSSTRVARRVDRVLLHTVSITGLTAVVVAIYLLVVIGLGRSPEDAERNVLLLSMLAAAAAALAYLPARERLTEVANRLVYGERHPPDEVLRTWGTRLSRSIPMDELLLQLAESLRKVMTLSRAEVWTAQGARLDLTVSVPDREAEPLQLGPEEMPIIARAGVSGNAWMEIWLPKLLEGRQTKQLRVAPASASGQIMGLVVVERPGDGDEFGEEDERVLAELARQVGVALHNVQLDSALQESLEEVKRANAELQASRARIVATGDAERRKIERNLHDGAQQHLVALAVNLRLAKDIMGDDPESAAEMLDMLADAVKDTIQELRDLAHGIYPPLLMDSGLSEALRAAANRSPLDVGVVAEGVGRYPSEVEAAIYFCCLEALQNAGKHAPDASVTITVEEAEGELCFRVVDDGPGFDVVNAKAGHGYVNMSDRLGAIGGSVEWQSAVGEGSTISGSVPVEVSTPVG